MPRHGPDLTTKKAAHILRGLCFRNLRRDQPGTSNPSG